MCWTTDCGVNGEVADEGYEDFQTFDCKLLLDLFRSQYIQSLLSRRHVRAKESYDLTSSKLSASSGLKLEGTGASLILTDFQGCDRKFVSYSLAYLYYYL